MLEPAPLIAFDLETTGLRPLSDRICEVGAVKFRPDGTVIARFHSLVNPGRPCHPEAFAAHGIADAELAAAPDARAVLALFAEFLGDRATTRLLAHNARFDKGFLLAGFGFAGIDVPRVLFNVIDTLPPARSRWPRSPGGHSLGALAAARGYPADGMHRAAADAERVRLLWLDLQGVG